MDPSTVVPREAPHGPPRLKAIDHKTTRPFRMARNPRNFVQRPSQEDLREKLHPKREARPTPAASVFDRLGAESSIAPSQPVHSRRIENSEARTEKVKGSKHGSVEHEEVKERPECYEDDDDENLPFTNELKAMEGTDELSNAHHRQIQRERRFRGSHQHIQDEAPGTIPRSEVPEFSYHAHIRHEEVEDETVKSYFKRFSNVINKIETVTDKKALDALMTGLHMCTLFWRDVQNSQPKTYSQLVDLVQREIRSEETIENREKAERERGNRYRREGRHSSEPRFSQVPEKTLPRATEQPLQEVQPNEGGSCPLPKVPATAPLPATTPPKFCRIHRTRVYNTEDCPDKIREIPDSRYPLRLPQSPRKARVEGFAGGHVHTSPGDEVLYARRGRQGSQKSNEGKDMLHECLTKGGEV
ncbi:Uncharacterized protein Adt_24187 [Abeliophyllum distichum]|uniref:Retrotransposon gag domain-containing protein n=1 Tax=Abeliophyllum distichum TaxID=126358 RepID=A0ABD1SG13_9LAMI